MGAETKAKVAPTDDSVATETVNKASTTRKLKAESQKKEEPGMSYFMAKLTMQMMKRCGIDKEEAEQLISDKWNAMSAEEKDFFTQVLLG